MSHWMLQYSLIFLYHYNIILIFIAIIPKWSLSNFSKHAASARGVVCRARRTHASPPGQPRRGLGHGACRSSWAAPRAARWCRARARTRCARSCQAGATWCIGPSDPSAGFRKALHWIRGKESDKYMKVRYADVSYLFMLSKVGVWWAVAEDCNSATYLYLNMYCWNSSPAIRFQLLSPPGDTDFLCTRLPRSRFHHICT